MDISSKYGGSRIKAAKSMPKKLGVLVGVLRGTGEHPNAKGGQTIAEIAWWNEFGTDRGIPERPFLRTAVRGHSYYRTEMKDATAYAVKALVLGLPGYDVKLRLVGMAAARDVQSSIVTGPWTPNAESTIRKKSRGLKVESGEWLKAKPLIDTGALRASITWGFDNA